MKVLTAFAVDDEIVELLFLRPVGLNESETYFVLCVTQNF